MLEAQPYPIHQRAELDKQTTTEQQIQVDNNNNKELEDLLSTTDQFFSPEEIYK
jgi:hypothetical protein